MEGVIRRADWQSAVPFKLQRVGVAGWNGEAQQADRWRREHGHEAHFAIVVLEGTGFRGTPSPISYAVR